MLDKIRKINIKKAGVCSVTIGVINIIVHILIITQTMPYTWVNGGRSVSYELARQTSLSSIYITIFNIIIALIASKIIPLKMNKFWSKFLTIFLVVTLPLGLIGIGEQFLGTIFEKCCMSIVAIIGFLSDTRIAVEKRW
ncbi:hypothetical protein [Clostridium estertheticum]|uniref:Uncharacterized protein n=1 Tax=Clostridium estertheticum TaxID=238834 RepID=A0A7Y3SZ41_9CLOT|nr:hypothetical protein [Clostridium estertheticum]NNU78068.1 hypothetical protein [Clostridium estertheticum]WBL49502.1 hypothetical protein LOR37_21900 [Clostridium estertheticum]